jgi:hypothetical protein
MTTEKYKTTKGVSQFRPVMTKEEFQESTFFGDPGFCLACGERTDGCEPDAERYECDNCGQKKVYGLEQLLFMGLLQIREDGE